MFSIYGGNAILVKDIAVDQSIPSEYCFESKDVILKANGKNVYMITDLMSAIEGKDAGELVDFTVIRNGKTGFDGENNHTIEFSLKLDSNPEFTSSVLVAYARAIYRMHNRGEVGCKTVLDIAPADLSEMSGEELRAKML
jgi:hypothetical protein